MFIGKDGHGLLDADEADSVLVLVLSADTRSVGYGRKSWVVTGQHNQWIRYNGHSCWASVYQSAGQLFFYVKLEHAEMGMGDPVRVVGSTICGNIRHMYNGQNGDTFYDWLLDNYVYLRRMREVDKDNYNYNTADKVTDKVSQFHHVHVRLADVFSSKEIVNLSGFRAYLARALDGLSNNSVTHTTFWVYYMALDLEHRKLFEALVCYYGGLDKNWLKTEGTKTKQMQHLAKIDLAPIFELNVLENRIETEVDWKTEKANRTDIKTTVYTHDEIRYACEKLFSKAKAEGRNASRLSWRDYWDQRLALTPGGSVHSKYSEDQAIINSLERNVRSKKTFLACVSDGSIHRWLNRDPEINSTTSTKYEWGKVRALYGCDITTHVLADYGLNMCENTFPHFMPTGKFCTREYVQSEVNWLRGTIPFCYDYDDFNSQHSISSMQAVLYAWLNVYKDDIEPEQHAAVAWTIASLNTQIVNNNSEGDSYYAKGTLFSGWRLTAFVNTALNYAYLYKAGLEEHTVGSLHNGDDVYAGVTNLAHAMKLVKQSKKYGVRANVSKMSIGTIAEFLRVDMMAGESTMSQYLTRGIATFVHSRIESDAPLAERSMLQAFHTRWTEILERGADPKKIKRLYDQQIKFTSSRFGNDMETLQEVIDADVSVGGLTKGGNVTNFRYVDVPAGTNENIDAKVRQQIDIGLGQYTAYLRRQLPQSETFITKEKVWQAFESNLRCKMTKITKQKVRRKKLYTELAMMGAWKGRGDIRVIHKLRLGITDIVMAMVRLSDVCSQVLNKSDNPVKWLSLLTK